MPELIDLSQDDDDDDRVQPPVVELLDDDDDSPLRRRSTNTTLVSSSSSSSLRRRFDASTTAPLPIEGRSSTQPPPPASSSVRSHIRHPEREAPPRELLWLLPHPTAARSQDLAWSTTAANVRFPSTSPRRHRAPTVTAPGQSTRGSRSALPRHPPRRPRHPPLRDLDHVVTQEQLWFLLGTTRTTPAPPPPPPSSLRSHIRHPEREASPRELLWLLRQSSAPAVRSPDLAESTAVRFPSPRRHRAPAPLRGDPSTRGSRRSRTTLPRRPRHPPLRDLDHVVTQEQLWFLLGTTRTTPAPPPPQQYHHNHPPEDWDNHHGPTYEELLSMFGMGNENYGASMTDVSLLPVVTITAQDMTATTTTTCCAATDPDRYRCSICFEDYQVGHHKKILPCFHNFHESCIDPWLVQNGSCPICKHGIACTTTNATTR